jgi:hypothetical protein
MKKEFAEFLFKRISSKLDDIPNISEDYDAVARHVDDIDDYLKALKEIVFEVIS